MIDCKNADQVVAIFMLRVVDPERVVVAARSRSMHARSSANVNSRIKLKVKTREREGAAMNRGLIIF